LQPGPDEQLSTLSWDKVFAGWLKSKDFDEFISQSTKARIRGKDSSYSGGSSPRDSNGLISYITKARIIGKIQAPLGGLISNKELQPVPDESSFPTYLGQGLWVVHKRSLSHCSTRQ
jgi:hypothetical protein